MDFGQSADTYCFAEVDVTSNSCGAGVVPDAGFNRISIDWRRPGEVYVPVDRLRGEFFGGRSFDGVDPTFESQISIRQ